MALSLRAGNIRPFVEFRDYDNGAGSTMQVGVTTYSELDNGDQAYKTTYLEWGGRSDHLDDAIDTLRGREVTVRRVSDANETERRYVGSNERNGIEAPKLETVDVTPTEPTKAAA